MACSNHLGRHLPEPISKSCQLQIVARVFSYVSVAGQHANPAGAHEQEFFNMLSNLSATMTNPRNLSVSKCSCKTSREPLLETCNRQRSLASKLWAACSCSPEAVWWLVRIRHKATWQHHLAVTSRAKGFGDQNYVQLEGLYLLVRTDRLGSGLYLKGLASRLMVGGLRFRAEAIGDAIGSTRHPGRVCCVLGLLPPPCWVRQS